MGVSRTVEVTDHRRIRPVSTFTVTAERLVIEEHPDADALELARVGGYRAVVAKGSYTTGEYAVYIPEQAVLPEELIEELGLVGRLAGAGRNRVKAVRLRGALSQGLVCRPSALADVDLEQAAAAGRDFSGELGITKWVPHVPVHMSGEVEPCGQMLPWVDVENIKRHPDVLTLGEQIVVTEKVHGTSLLCGVADDGTRWVTSKGHGSSRRSLVEDPDNLYWRAVADHGLLELAEALGGELGATRVGLHGEVYGQGVQDLSYGGQRNEVGFVCFDVSYDTGDGVQRWVDAAALAEVVAGRVPCAPVLYAGPYSPEVIAGLVDGVETVSGQGAHLREGVVIRTATERFDDRLGGRAILKAVSEDYLTRSGGTEYE